MSQNPANELNQSDSRNEQSESMLDESLPQDFYHMGPQKQNESVEMSGSNESSVSTSNNGCFAQKIKKIKCEFVKEREKILEGTSFRPKLVTDALMKNEQYEKDLKSKTQELNRLLQNHQEDNKNKNQLQFETQELDNELRLMEEISEFKQRIIDSLQQERPVLQQEEPLTDIKGQIVSKLQQRSKAMLQKLRPYLSEHLRINGAKNQQIQELNLKLDKDSKVYTDEFNRLQKQIHQNQSTKVIYQLQDQIENEKHYGGQLDKYIARNDTDIKFRKSRNF